MRLSELGDVDGAIDVIHAALDAGIRSLDTADAYGPGGQIGHNERLVARALASWTGDAPIRVITKGGLTRPRAQWVPNGKAKHLAAACRASLESLGRSQHDLYLLHAPDPKVPLATSVRALAKLKKQGLATAVGLSNVNLTQLREAEQLTDIAAVQVELSVAAQAPLYSGLVAYCREQGIEVIAHSPLGGPGRSRGLPKRGPLLALARQLGVTAHQLALAWLLDLDAGVTPIPGATRVETAGLAAAAPNGLPQTVRQELDQAFGGGRRMRESTWPAQRDDDVILVMGIQGAGKSGYVTELTEQGYERLNRDERGGTLAGLLPPLEAGLAEGRRRWTLDNTYPTRAQRGQVIDAARAHGAGVRCVWMDTPLHQAQFNAVFRLIERYGELPDPDSLSQLSKRD
ncbi:MAG: aryl-alcohol dehydrogenase-like predicted oxidoreductase, partial [Myxococcota bacterium]